MANNSGRHNQPGQSAPQNNQPQQLDPTAIQAFIDNQRLEAQNEAARLRIREREIDANAAYAQTVVNHQAAILSKKPAEDRKTIVTIAAVLAVFAAGLIWFVIYCLSINEREFIYKILQGLGYLVTSALGYYFGQKSGKKSKPDPNGVQDAEVVNE